MAILSILRYPDARLKTVATAVTQFDDALRDFIRDLSETMYSADGVGLAATQVDRHERILVMDVSEARDQLLVLINPSVHWASDEWQRFEEGCLSVPGIYDEVERPAEVRINAVDEQGVPFELEASGLLAICVQHEIDHLDGKVFVEKLSLLKQERIKTKLKKAAAKGNDPISVSAHARAAARDIS